MNTKTVLLLRVIAGISALGGTSAYLSNIGQQQGVVKGILCVPGSSSAVIDTQIVYEGESIYGVKVVNIERSTVEFEKNGKRWKQRVLERANPAWGESYEESY